MTPEGAAIFEHVVCGVDGTPESLGAVRQAARLLADGGELRLVAAADVAKAVHAGAAAPHAARLVESEAEAALADARKIAPGATTRLANGDPVAVLLREAEDATLVAVGSHGRGRTAGVLLGTVAARMLRDAPCSVLVARERDGSDAWPRSIVAGVDGSPGSAAAFAVARSVAKRFGATLRVLASTTDELDAEAARAVAPDLEEQPAKAVALLTEASESADLVVVGSRGLRGLKALGSVSERVAHRARSSVLVVRLP